MRISREAPRTTVLFYRKNRKKLEEYKYKKWIITGENVLSSSARLNVKLLVEMSHTIQ
jgi:hypothetical protein